MREETQVELYSRQGVSTIGRCDSEVIAAPNFNVQCGNEGSSLPW